MIPCPRVFAEYVVCLSPWLLSAINHSIHLQQSSREDLLLSLFIVWNWTVMGQLRLRFSFAKHLKTSLYDSTRPPYFDENIHNSQLQPLQLPPPPKPDRRLTMARCCGALERSKRISTQRREEEEEKKKKKKAKAHMLPSFQFLSGQQIPPLQWRPTTSSGILSLGGRISWLDRILPLSGSWQSRCQHAGNH